MREMFVGTRDELGEDGAVYHFAYYVLIGEMMVNDGFACESYGVKIADASCPEEAVSVPNLTVSASRIDELMGILTRNLVTPASLRDVVDDWL